jgi:hypothetical protein
MMRQGQSSRCDRGVRMFFSNAEFVAGDRLDAKDTVKATVRVDNPTTSS